MTLSGGMKRRVMIAKALSHEPDILFLDEPTAGVDVELRRDMWALVRRLRDAGVTIILTTHYIDEAEEMADRIGIITKGELIAGRRQGQLMQKLGKRQLTLQLQEPMTAIPAELSAWRLALKGEGTELEYTFDAKDQSSTSRRCCAGWRTWASDSRTSPRDRARSRRSSSAWSATNRGADMTTATVPAFNRHGVCRHLPLRDGPVLSHAAPERGHAGHHHVALFRRVRLGHRLAHVPGRRRALRRVHRARA